MNFQSFNCVYDELNAPDNLEYHVDVDKINYVSLNTAGDDEENTGDYFVWIHIAGDALAVFRGTKTECKAYFDEIKAVLK